MKHFHRFFTLFTGATFLLAIMSAVYATATSLSPGDILIADQSGAVIRVDSMTGAQTVISSGGNFADPFGIALSPDGDIFVADATALGGAVIRVVPETGAQFVISSGGNFNYPMDIAVELSGDILVTDDNNALGAVIRVNPSTGAQTVVSYGGSLVDSAGITVASDGRIIVANPNTSSGSGSGAIIEVNPITGAQVTISTGGIFFDPWWVTMDQSGQILVSDHNSPAGEYFCGGYRGAIISVAPLSGDQTVVSAGYPFTQPNDVAVEEDGNILVVDPYAYQTICTGTGIPTLFRINSVSGDRSVLSSAENLSLPRGIAVVPAIVNEPPLVDAGPDLSISGDTQAFTVLEGITTDADGDVLMYRWLEGDTVLLDWMEVGENGDAPLDLSLVDAFSYGLHTFTLEVDDGTIIVSDNMTLTVLTPEEEAENVEDVLEDMLEEFPPITPLGDKIEDSLEKVQNAIAKLDDGDKQAAIGELEGAVGDLQAAVDDGLLDSDYGKELMDRIAGIARQIAVDALQFAIENGGKPDEIADAQGYLAEGDDLRTSEAFKDAVSKYKDALSKAESAVN